MVLLTELSMLEGYSLISGISGIGHVSKVCLKVVTLLI